MELNTVVDDKKEGKKWFGYSIVGTDEFVKNKDGVLIFASLNEEEIDVFCKEQENVKIVVLRD